METEMNRNKTLQLANAGMIAALYVVLTWIANRCVLANLLTGCAAWDVVFGSLATLIGAVGTRLLKDKPLLAWIPPVVSNAVIVPIILIKVYGVPDAWWYLVLTVGAGEIIACGILGLLLWRSLKNIPQIRNMK